MENNFTKGQTVVNRTGQVLTVLFQVGIMVTTTNGKSFHHTKLFAR